MKLRSIAIEPTNQCNLGCRACYGKNARLEGLMSLELARKVLTEAKKLGVSSVGMHFMGEPTLHPDYPLMLRLAGDLGFEKVTLSTNGMAVSDAVVEAIIAARISVVNISVHTTSDEPIKLGHRLREARARARQKRPRITSNYSPDGADPRTVQQICERYSEAVDSIGIAGTIKGMRWTDLPKGAVGSKRTHCHQPMRYVAVLWDGRLTICCRDLAGKLAFGDVTHSTLAKELVSATAVRRRNEIAQHGCPKDRICQSCQLWQTIYSFPVWKG